MSEFVFSSEIELRKILNLLRSKMLKLLSRINNTHSFAARCVPT